MALRTLTVNQEGITLDLLLFREFRQEVRFRVEETLDRNRYLAEKGLFLPLGMKVEIDVPDVPPDSVEVVRVKRLW